MKYILLECPKCGYTREAKLEDYNHTLKIGGHMYTCPNDYWDETELHKPFDNHIYLQPIEIYEHTEINATEPKSVELKTNILEDHMVLHDNRIKAIENVNKFQQEEIDSIKETIQIDRDFLEKNREDINILKERQKSFNMADVNTQSEIRTILQNIDRLDYNTGDYSVTVAVAWTSLLLGVISVCGLAVMLL